MICEKRVEDSPRSEVSAIHLMFRLRYVRFRRFHRIAIAVIAALVTTLISVTHVNASDTPFYWDSINVDINVQQNGEMWVTETQHYVFKSSDDNQRYRYIPLNKVDEIRDVTVTEKAQPLPVTTGTENEQFWIRWQHPLHPPESHVFVIKYRVLGGLQVYPENTQVYWKAIFADRKAVVQSSTVVVHLPEAVSGQVNSYTAYGANVSHQIDPKTFKFTTDQPLIPGEEVEIQISFPSSILNLPQPQWQQFGVDRVLQFASRNLLYILCGVPFFYIAFWIPARIISSCRCPQCKKLTLRTQSHTFAQPTRYASGQARVIQHCNHCSYHQEFDKLVPYIDHSRVHAGGGDGGGGGSSGGGGGDGGGGGGGG